jgi:hypothetical protein
VAASPGGRTTANVAAVTIAPTTKTQADSWRRHRDATNRPAAVMMVSMTALPVGDSTANSVDASKIRGSAIKAAHTAKKPALPLAPFLAAIAAAIIQLAA